MKTALLIHGCCEAEEFYGEAPSASNSHWLPWLQKQLVKHHVETQTPEMPMPCDPHYADWKRVLEMFPIDEHTLLVGHSCGAGFLLRWLTEEKRRAHKLVLVAPWLDPFKTRGPFLDFVLDRQVQARVKAVHILYSEDDVVEGVSESVAMLSQTFPSAHTHPFKDKGHFAFDNVGTQFPELRDLILGCRE